ncbi:hypothetical protein JQK87_11205 [Streptomyces sp. G44]|uniref:hypothetical protein n=1 Tax=Streptomyces sp. G44 TaxID=2807632 RepID=UPI001961E672|nr:hypothetical protein [Streptomyces sp. G44]MBM7168974.1 hypothetical protein [Streptomyces sp. G44]
MPTCLALCGTPVLPSGPCPPEERHRSTVLYEDIVRPACEQLGLTLLRADSLTQAGLPRDQLLRMLTEADVVIADLSGFDAELSFGLGMRHALGRCTVHVEGETDQLPAPGMTQSIQFPTRPDDIVATRRQLTGLLATEALHGHSSPSLPAAATPATDPKPDPEDDEDVPGLFDLVVEAEAHMEALTGDMEDVESALADLGEMMALIGEDMSRTGHAGASAGRKKALVNRLAKALDGPAEELEAAAERFAERMGASVDALRVFLQWASTTPRAEWPEDTEEVLEQVVAAPWEMQAVAGPFREGVALINMFGASSRQLRRPARRITASLQAIFQSVSVLVELQSLAMALRE